MAAYQIASRVQEEKMAFNAERINENGQEMVEKERKQYKDINEAHQ